MSGGVIKKSVRKSCCALVATGLCVMNALEMLRVFRVSCAKISY